MFDLPQDPVMLMSFMNQKLRDHYPSLDAFCEDYDIDKEEIIQKLKAINFEYIEDINQFK